MDVDSNDQGTRNSSLLVATGEGARSGATSIEGGLRHSSILARGFSQPRYAAQQSVLRSRKIGSDVVESNILAGYSAPESGINGDVSIGRVLAGGAWTRSDLAVGVGRGADSIRGTENDSVLPDSDDLIASIARITIRGGLNAEPLGGQPVISGEYLKSLSFGGKMIALVSGPHYDSLASASGTDGELLIREVRRQTEQA